MIVYGKAEKGIWTEEKHPSDTHQAKLTSVKSLEKKLTRKQIIDKLIAYLREDMEDDYA